MPCGQWFKADLASGGLILGEGLLDGGGHPRNRHQRLRDLVEQLVRIFFLAKRLVRELRRRAADEAAARGFAPSYSRRSRSARRAARRRSARDRRGIVLLLAFRHHFLAFLDKARHALARLGARLALPSSRSTRSSRSTCASVSCKMTSNSVCSWSSAQPSPSWAEPSQLLFGVQDVPQLVDQQLLDRAGSTRSNFRHGWQGCCAGIVNSWNAGASTNSHCSPSFQGPRRRFRLDRLRRSSR